jgi:hypothetical protein
LYVRRNNPSAFEFSVIVSTADTAAGGTPISRYGAASWGSNV